jgi:hypothetical protein
MTYTSDQYKRDKSAMLGEFNRAIADAAELCKPATQASIDSPVAERVEHESVDAGAAPAGSGTAVKTGTGCDRMSEIR